MLFDVAHVLHSANSPICKARKLLQGIAKKYPGLLKSKSVLVKAIQDLEDRQQLSVEGVLNYFQGNDKDEKPLTHGKKKQPKSEKQPYIQIIYTPMGGKP